MLLLTGTIGPSPASAEGNGAWSLKPAGADGTTGSRSFFDHQVEPGHAVRDLARLANLTDAPLTFSLYAADAYTTADGGPRCTSRPTPGPASGPRVSLPADTITVPAESAVTFPIQIGVPADAAPGDWAGGVVALHRGPGRRDGGATWPGGRAGGRRRIYVRVGGPLQPSLAVNDVDLDVERLSWAPVGQPARAEVSYAVANTGNTRVTGEARLEITDTFGRTVRTFPDRTFTDLLPAEDMTFTETWAGLPLTGIRYRAHVVATAQDVSTEASSPGAWHPPALVLVALLSLVAVGALERDVVGGLVSHEGPSDRGAPAGDGGLDADRHGARRSADRGW